MTDKSSSRAPNPVYFNILWVGRTGKLPESLLLHRLFFPHFRCAEWHVHSKLQLLKTRSQRGVHLLSLMMKLHNTRGPTWFSQTILGTKHFPRSSRETR